MRAPEPPAAPPPGAIRIVIDDEGNVTLSDLPADLADLVRELGDDPAQIARHCPLPDPAPEPGTKA